MSTVIGGKKAPRDQRGKKSPSFRRDCPLLHADKRWMHLTMTGGGELRSTAQPRKPWYRDPLDTLLLCYWRTCPNNRRDSSPCRLLTPLGSWHCAEWMDALPKSCVPPQCLITAREEDTLSAVKVKRTTRCSFQGGFEAGSVRTQNEVFWGF